MNLLDFSEILEYYNPDLENIVTPFNVDLFEDLLKASQYDQTETEFLVKGFHEGFDIGYQGPTIRQSTSKNIPFTIGDKHDMWSKVMKEVKEGCYAGPFNEIPFDNYIQSPIGLVPKAGNKTRLIFHLSYDFDKTKNNQSNHREQQDKARINGGKNIKGEGSVNSCDSKRMVFSTIQ